MPSNSRDALGKKTEDELLDIGDMAVAPSTQMFPRGCQQLNKPVGGM
jgi:hypothetical protein